MRRLEGEGSDGGRCEWKRGQHSVHPDGGWSGVGVVLLLAAAEEEAEVLPRQC